MTDHKDLLAIYQKIGDVAGQIKHTKNTQKRKKTSLVVGSSRNWTPSELIKMQWKRLDILVKAIDMPVAEILIRLGEIEEQVCEDCKLAINNGSQGCAYHEELVNEHSLLRIALP